MYGRGYSRSAFAMRTNVHMCTLCTSDAKVLNMQTFNERKDKSHIKLTQFFLNCILI